MKRTSLALFQSIPARWLIPITLGLIVFFCDQVTKAWVVDQLGPQPFIQAFSLGPSWLNLVYSQNTGVAFGLFQQMPRLFLFTSVLITTGAIYAYIVYLPNQIRWVQITMGLTIGGAFGNISDRLRFGSVVDFISIGWWPVFNLADSAITVGVCCLASYLIFIGDEPPPPPRSTPRDDGLLSDLLNRDVE